jgi:hypothetical protein
MRWEPASSSVPGASLRFAKSRGGGGYLSHSDLRAHFGLDPAAKIDQLEIAWRSGAEANLCRFLADPFYSIQAGKDELRLRPFVKTRTNWRVPRQSPNRRPLSPSP